MDPDSEIRIKFPPFFRVYKSGRVERLVGTTTVAASLDPSPAGVHSRDVAISPAVSARLYLPNDTSPAERLPIVIYYHGGGFCIESAFSPLYHPYLTSFSSRARSLVVSVEYRLAPEHRLPAAHDDAWTAFRWAFGPDPDEWLVRHGDTKATFLAGDSAGANLAHYVATRASAEGIPIEGMVLVHPYFGPKTDGAAMRRVWDVISEMDIEDVRHKPAADGGKAMMAGLRCGRVMVAVAERDMLKGRGVAYWEALRGSGWGGEAELVETEGEDHVFHLLRPGCSKGEELMERIVAFINGRQKKK
ncbi:putative tuliposide A-converting enzyme 1, chloroplastic [Iris pallida]|uniref:Tuliposide A-converting enzyme 1, chloroplastic n=1 Tax=Iris pallida TaxID=29817 RepID=A0AAX6GWN1_IRIPA|nr:putative tuliposide A-converting enzyme 1, chloroplastic [Iris pallida]